MQPHEQFKTQVAFSRNRGLITCDEQKSLMKKLVVIPGCGGVGGIFAETLARLGVGNFRIADDDIFEIGNFNRQAGAKISNLKKNKANITAQAIKEINPHAHVDVWQCKVTHQNVEKFIEDADVALDGIDFYSISDRRKFFHACWQAQIPAITSAPLGFSSTLHIFDQGGMTFDEYFDLQDRDNIPEQLLKFLIGLAPQSLNRSYTDFSAIDPINKTGPSSIIGTQQAANMVGVEVLKILLNRNPSAPAPHYMQFDNYNQKLAKSRLFLGNRHPRQLLARWLVKRGLIKMGIWQQLEHKYQVGYL